MKYKSTLARGLSHAWPWTKPIGSSPTASRLLRYSLLCMLVLLCGGSAWADGVTESPYKHVFSTTDKTFTGNGTKTLSGVNWTLDATWFDTSKTDYNKDTDWGLKIGSNNKPVQTIVLTSKSGDIPGTITSVKVSSKCRSGATCNLSVSVGGTTFTYVTDNEESVEISKDGGTYEFTGTGSGSIVITCGHSSTTGSTGAIYIKDIEVTFSTSKEYAKKPVIEPTNGTVFKTSSQKVTITSETEGATILYTLNGGDQQTYTGPFTITKTTTIKAWATKEGMEDSQPTTATITYKDPTLIVSADFNDLTEQSSSSFNYTNADGTWTGEKMSPEVGYVKLGSSSAKGTVTTPKSEDFTEYAILTFKAKQYNSSEKSVTVTISGDGSISGNTEITDLGEDFAEYKVKITGGTANTQLTISAKRAYIDDIVIKTSEPFVEVTEPTFTPAAGTYYGIQSVTLACTTEGADIYYSTDGENFTKYSAPIEVAATTTIYAYSQVGEEKSATVSATYNIVIPITTASALNAAAIEGGKDGKPVTYNFTNAKVVYVNGSYNYIADETGYALLYKSNLGLTAGKVITGTLTGTAKTYNDLPEIAVTSIEVTSSADDTDVPAPTTISIDELANNVNNYIKVENAEYVSASSKTLTFNVGETNLTVYNQFGLSTTGLTAGKIYNITGFGSINNSTNQIYPTEITEYVAPTPDPLYILGDMNSWDRTNPTQMTWDATKNAYTYELNNDAAVYFCFADGTQTADEATADNEWTTFNSTYRWAPGEGYTEFSLNWVGLPLTLQKANGTIKLPAGTWTISIAPNDTPGEMRMTITGEATPVEEHTYIVAGSEPEIFDTPWDPTNESNKMTKQNDGSYQKTYTVDQAYKGVQLKVVKNGSDWIGDDTGNNVSFNLTGAGNFTVSIDPTTSKVTVTGDIVSFALDYESVYAVGNGEDAWLNGAAWDPGYQDNQMTEVSDGVWEISFKNVPAGSARNIKFAIDGAWTHNFGGTFSEFGVATDAVYNGDNIEFDTKNDLQNIKVQLDLSNFNYATKQGAKFTISLEAAEEPGFRDIKLDLTQHSEVLTGSDVLITVAEDGTIGTTDNEEEAAAAVCGNVHSSYGSSNFTAIVPVEGCVKITYATHDFGNDITVTDDNGTEVAKLNTQGAKWMSDHANVVVAYYRTNEPTTLHFSNANYNPYFAVEAIDPADIPAEVTKYTVTFAAGDGVLGVAPAAIEVEAGSETTAPRNTSLYKEGYTLIGWESGNEVILPGAKFTPETDMELTAKFGVNEVSLADREEDVTITYVLDGYNDAPKYNFQSGDGIIVTQATVNEKTIDVAVNTNGMFANNNSGWTLLNKDTKVTVPSCKGATIKVTTYQNANALNFGETAAEPNANPATYTATAEDETLVITQTAQGYWSKLEITLPKVESTEPGGDDVSGVFFSANVIATEVQNFASGTTEITSAQATIVGGKMYAISAQETEKALINKQGSVYYFSITNNNTYFKVELDHALAVGDVITADGNGGVKNGSNKGLWVSTSDSYPSAAPACAGTSETEGIITNLLNYTIKEGDEYVGKTTLYIYRAVGATEYFGNLKITRPASDEPSETNLKEKAIIDTDFQDWAKSSETTMVTTKYTKENITFTYTNATVDPEATNEGKFPTTTDAAYKGYIMSAKSEATITTTTFASISKIRYRHGATGNNRGWGLKMKVGDGEWEIVSDATVGSTPAWIEKTIDKEKVQLQWYNLNTTQNAYMFELEVYAKVDLSNSPLLATLKANGTTYTAEDIFEMGTDDNYAATIELASSEAMPSAENPVEAVADNGEIGNITYETSNDQSVVTIPVTAGEASVNYVATFVRKPNFTLTYYNLDGEEIGTQQVEKDAKIGEFAYDIANVAASKEGYKARGWFKNNYVGEKWTTESVITADAKLYAVETEIEVSSDSKRYEFDLTDMNFDAADHEAFNPTGNGKWHDNQHGWAFADGDKLELLVGGKASIILGLCQYSADVKISASNDESVDAKVETDGTTATIEYEGEPGTLTLTFNGTTYLHKLTIFNTTTTNYEQDGEWIIVKEGDGSSLVDALFAAKEGTKIFLPNGTYDLGQKTLTTIGNNNVSIIGESMEGVIIKNRPTTEGIAVTATLLNTSTGLYMQDLTLDCVAPWSGSAERGVTLQDKGNQTILKNVYLKGLQDTYYSNNQNGTYYFEDGKIEGSVDYVCGNGDVYFNKTTFYTVNKSTGAVGGCIAAPNTLNSFGYIFNECTLDGAANEDGKYRLGRPWAANTKCLFVNTTMKIKPVAEGWGDWSPANPVKQFAEYNSKDAEENVISLDGRKNLFNGVENNPVLTEAEAEALAPDVIFNGEWKPQVIAQQVEAPVAELKDGVITWEKVDGATAYALFNNGSLMAIVDGETTSYTIEDAESGQGAPALLRGGEDSSTAYTIRAANGRGGFGVPKGVTLATGIQQISKELGADVKIYDLNGRRVTTPTTGVYIINGKKVVIK